MVVWLVFGRGRPAVGAVPVGVGAASAAVNPMFVLTVSLNAFAGGVEGGGVDAAEDEVDALEDLGIDIELWRGNRGMGSFACDGLPAGKR